MSRSLVNTSFWRCWISASSARRAAASAICGHTNRDIHRIGVFKGQGGSVQRARTVFGGRRTLLAVPPHKTTFMSKKRASRDESPETAPETVEPSSAAPAAEPEEPAAEDEALMSSKERRKAKKLRKKMAKGGLEAMPTNAPSSVVAATMRASEAKVSVEIQSTSGKNPLPLIQIEVDFHSYMYILGAKLRPA